MDSSLRQGGESDKEVMLPTILGSLSAWWKPRSFTWRRLGGTGGVGGKPWGGLGWPRRAFSAVEWWTLCWERTNVQSVADEAEQRVLRRAENCFLVGQHEGRGLPRLRMRGACDAPQYVPRQRPYPSPPSDGLLAGHFAPQELCPPGDCLLVVVIYQAAGTRRLGDMPGLSLSMHRVAVSQALISWKDFMEGKFTREWFLLRPVDLSELGTHHFMMLTWTFWQWPGGKRYYKR